MEPRMENVRRCSTCIMPESFPNIQFDEDGVCNFCSGHKPFEVYKEQSLLNLLNQKKGKEFDCLVPLSGGKDSTFVLYYIRKILNKRVLAVNYDSGFQSELAIENMRNTCKVLNVPLVSVPVNYDNQLKMLREILKISKILGNFYSICGNCETNIRTVAMNVAKEREIPFIIYGSSKFESVSKIYNPTFSGFRNIFGRIIRYHKKNIPRIIYHFMRYSYSSIIQRSELHVPLRYRFVPIGKIPFAMKGLEVVYLFDFIEWDSYNKINLLKEQLGWKSVENKPTRFDCLLHCFVNHVFLKESGISHDGVTCSTMVRQNRMTREEALTLEDTIHRSLDKECLEALEKICGTTDLYEAFRIKSRDA